MYAPEPEILSARKGWPDSQADLGGIAVPFTGLVYLCGWVDTRITEERGAFAVVNQTGPLAGLVGDILRIVNGQRSGFVYCVGATDLSVQEYDLAISRQAWARIEPLSTEEIAVVVEVVE